MEKINIIEVIKNKNYFLNEILNNKIFIYPTDTIYWIWWIVNKENVEKIYEIKWRDKNKPFSIIAPNMEWIINNFNTSNDFIKKFNEFEDKYKWITVILEKKIEWSFEWIWIKNKVWIRYINHEFQKIVEEINQPFITTSANISWNNYKYDLNKFINEFWEKIDYIIYDDKINKDKSSRIIDFTDNYKIIR